jgi:MFS family permease
MLDVIAYLASFALGLGPVFWLLISEIYPTTVRGRAMSVASVTIWVADCFVTMTFLSLVETLGPRAVFWLYAGTCAAALVFCSKLVPETKDRTLEEIEASW